MKFELNEQKIKEILIEENESFKSLNCKHEEFDLRLQELNNRSFKTAEDLLEERNIKKQKLQIKDSMQRYIFEFRKNGDNDSL